MIGIYFGKAKRNGLKETLQLGSLKVPETFAEKPLEIG